jgi:hypothetical protein
MVLRSMGAWEHGSMGGARHRSAPSAFMAGDCDTGLAFQLFQAFLSPYWSLKASFLFEYTLEDTASSHA